MINIIVRTANRPQHFKRCIESILQQTYKHITIWVGIERGDSKTINYVTTTKGTMHIVVYDKVEKEFKPTKYDDYGLWFPYNSYLDTIGKQINYGYVMYLDDDDILLDPTAIETIMTSIKNESDLVFWRVKFPERLVPCDNTWTLMKYNHPPVRCDVSGIGFCFHAKFLPSVEWGYWKLADYRVAKVLHLFCGKKIYIDKALTGTQGGSNFGAALE